MSKFNPVKNKVTQTVNKAGGLAYKETPEMELLGAVVSSFLSDGYYEKGNERIERIKSLVETLAVNNPVYLLGLAEKVRKDYHMRSTSHVLIAEISKHLNGEKYKMSDFVADAIERVDDMTEIISYLLPNGKVNGKVNVKAKSGVLKHSLVKGLAKAFSKFDEYQLAKYDKEMVVNLKDVVNIAHAGGELAKKVLDGTLATPMTWEVEISKISKTDPDYVSKVFNAWKNLVDAKKLGYMATLRNLRNIITAADEYKANPNFKKADADQLVTAVCDYLSNENAVKNSKQLPFRFLAAYKEMKNSNTSTYLKEVKDAITKAAEFSIANLEIAGDTAVFTDVSGSMGTALSAKSTITIRELGLLFASMATKASKRGVSGIFGDIAKLKDFGSSVFSGIENYRDSEVGYSTNGHLAIDLLTENKTSVDNIMLFTDCEMYGGSIENSLKNYRKLVNPDVKTFVFNLAGNGTKVSNHGNVYVIHGWSEKIFEYVRILDSLDSGTLTKEIEENGKKYVR